MKEAKKRKKVKINSKTPFLRPPQLKSQTFGHYRLPVIFPATCSPLMSPIPKAKEQKNIYMKAVVPSFRQQRLLWWC